MHYGHGYSILVAPNQRYIYVGGGYDNGPDPIDVGVPTLPHSLNYFCRFNVHENVWQTLSPMIHATANPHLLLYTNSIYTIGSTNNVVQRYNITQNYWQQLSSIPQALCNTTAVIYKTNIILAGIRIYETHYKLLIYQYTPILNHWYTLYACVFSHPLLQMHHHYHFQELPLQLFTYEDCLYFFTYVPHYRMYKRILQEVLIIEAADSNPILLLTDNIPPPPPLRHWHYHHAFKKIKEKLLVNSTENLTFDKLIHKLSTTPCKINHHRKQIGN